MKRRTGFVSNSSSASYIVQFLMDKSDFLELYRQHLWYAGIDEFHDHLKETVGKYEKVLEEAKVSKESAELHDQMGWTDGYKKRVKWLKKLSKKWKKLTAKAQIRIYLGYHGIQLKGDEDMVTLNLGTTMHNSYADVHPKVQEILTMILFEARHVAVRVDVQHGGLFFYDVFEEEKL